MNNREALMWLDRRKIAVVPMNRSITASAKLVAAVDRHALRIQRRPVGGDEPKI